MVSTWCVILWSCIWWFVIKVCKNKDAKLSMETGSVGFVLRVWSNFPYTIDGNVPCMQLFDVFGWRDIPEFPRTISHCYQFGIKLVFLASLWPQLVGIGRFLFLILNSIVMLIDVFLVLFFPLRGYESSAPVFLSSLMNLFYYHKGRKRICSSDWYLFVFFPLLFQRSC